MPPELEGREPGPRRLLLMPLRPGPPAAAPSVRPPAGPTGPLPTEPTHELAASSAELQALLLFAEATSLDVTSHAAAALLLDTVVSTYGFARAAVLAGTHQFTIIASHGLDSGSPPRGESASVHHAQDTTDPLIITLDSEREPWLCQLAPAGAVLLLQPLARDHRRFGALILQVPLALQGPPRRSMFARVTQLAAMTSEAMHREHRLGQLQRLAATDDLTMIANRRSFDASLEREMARALRNGEPLGLALLDLDLFKQVNDVHGHPAGDDLLRNVAAALVGACRDLDTPARYGGEEFAVILPDCAPEDALRIVERLRLAVAAAPGATQVTASAGVATYPHHASTAEQLIKTADEALLAAKRAGRNQTIVAAHPPSQSLPQL